MNTPNAQQLAVIESTASTIAVCATAGAGKTATLVARIKHQHALYPNAYRVCLTFTNSAARELHERIEGTPVGFIGTLHAYCFGLLQKHGEWLGYRAGGINLMTEDQSRDLLMDVAVELGYATRFGGKIKWRSGMSMKMLQIGQEPWASAVWKEYHHRLKRNNMVDYDRVLEAAALLPVHWAEQLRHIDELYVDEVQDSGELDWKIYTSLPVANWFFVGDPDQSVYKFRGGAPEKYLAILRRLGDKVHVLDRCYRCGTGICEAASRLIAHNTERIPHEVIASEPRDCLIERTECADDRSERAGVVQLIQRAIDMGTPPSEIAVLVRRNDLAQQFRDSLEAVGLMLPRQASELPRDWGFALDCLSMLNDPANDLVTERVLKGLKFTPDAISDAKTRALHIGVHISKTSIWDKTLEDGCARPSDAAYFLSKMSVSREAVALIQERVGLLPQFSLPALLHDLYGSDKWAPKQEPGIRVSTIHGFKGLEADCVFIAACEEGIMPTLREGSDIEEERRLFFIGMTRARSALYVSWARERFAWGKSVAAVRSRFVTEAFGL